jgi:hypothetical protein
LRDQPRKYQSRPSDHIPLGGVVVSGRRKLAASFISAFVYTAS